MNAELHSRHLCPACGHPWAQHNSTDGKCDHWEADLVKNPESGPCRCGRDVSFHREANRRLATLALGGFLEPEDRRGERVVTLRDAVRVLGRITWEVLRRRKEPEHGAKEDLSNLRRRRW